MFGHYLLFSSYLFLDIAKHLFYVECVHEKNQDPFRDGDGVRSKKDSKKMVI